MLAKLEITPESWDDDCLINSERKLTPMEKEYSDNLEILILVIIHYRREMINDSGDNRVRLYKK